MKLVSEKIGQLIKNQEALATSVASALIKESGLPTQIEWGVGSIKVYGVLPGQEVWEEAMAVASRSPLTGEPLDERAADPRFQRFLLSRCISRLGDEVEFELDNESDDAAKQLILAKLPRIMVERMWFSFLAQRNAFLMMLVGPVDDALKKSPATEPGAPNGDSSGQPGESDTGTASPN